MSSEAAQAWANVLRAAQALEVAPLTLAEIAREAEVPLERVVRWANAETAPTRSDERRLATVVRRRLTAGEALALGLDIGPGNRIWTFPKSRRRRRSPARTPVR